MNRTKRFVVVGVLLAVLAAAGMGTVFWDTPPAASAQEVTVYKSPTCGCCGRWVEYLREEGFQVEAVNVRDMNAVKRRMDIPYDVASCHTAVVDGYVVEGHVPAREIRRMLSERPQVRGIAVPKMPVGSPGMEQGARKDPYNVVTFDENGDTRVYERYPTSQ